MPEVKLKIADTIIRLRSKFPLLQLSQSEERAGAAERFNNFFYQGAKKADISIAVEVVDNLPVIANAEPLFITYHFEDGKENWRLMKDEDAYVYRSPLEDREQLMRVNRTFDEVSAFLLAKKERGKVWTVTDIIYDFLQVLLINYFAQRGCAIFTHAVGIKDTDGRGLLFAGKSGAGKSTTARLWHKHSRAMVLNDDRIIVRRIQDKFFIYGSPWHGDFSDYLASRIESAVLEQVFFIQHSAENQISPLTRKDAFTSLYPALFPAFWDKQCLENIVSFCGSLVRDVPCLRLGFVNDKEIIKFVRNVVRTADIKRRDAQNGKQA